MLANIIILLGVSGNHRECEGYEESGNKSPLQ